MKKIIGLVASLWLISMLVVGPLFAQPSSVGTLLVLNSPSTISAGTDSILAFDLAGKSTVFFGASHNVVGMQDIACDPTGAQHVFVSLSAFDQGIHEVREFDAAGNVVNTLTGFGSPGQQIVLAFDRAGNLYVASEGKVFKNGAVLATLCTDCGFGDIAIDSRGNIYVTDVNTQIFRVDPLGNVTVFADASNGLNEPHGIAINSADHVFVAVTRDGLEVAILKFTPSGTATTFATGLLTAGRIRGLAFDANDNLYVPFPPFLGLPQEDKILKFDAAGNSSVFADASDGIDFPASLAFGTCPVGAAVREVAADIKPGSFPNTINLKSNGVIPVAILTTADFDATTVDPLSVKFGPQGALEAHGKGHIEDVNGDGKKDLVLHFRTQETGIACGATSVSLTGETFQGEQIQGTGAITTVGCKKP